MILSKLEENFIKLYVSGITGKTFNLIDVDVDEIYNLAVFHSVCNVIYFGLKNHNIGLDERIIKNDKLSKHKTATQEIELEILKQQLDSNNIPYIFLKGSMLKKYYSSSHLREMADIDFLVHKKDLKKVGKILVNQGYFLDHAGVCHDVYIKKPFMNFEVHSLLFDEESLLYNYNLDIWNKAKKINNTSEYIMTNEEVYIYNLAHAAKHFRFGGTGIRILGDIYLFSNKENLNFEYINEELLKYQLVDFSTIIYSLANNLFNGNELKEDEKLVLKFLITSGTYGTISNLHGLEAAKTCDDDLSKKKRKVFFKRAFPSFKNMAAKYPKLKKNPILLPYYYLKRMWKYIFKFKRIKQEINAIGSIKRDNIDFLSKVLTITNISEEIGEE